MATTKLEKLTLKREQLNAQIQALKAKENQNKRKEDTKRKILIGGVVLKMICTGEMPQDRPTQILDKHLTKDDDRALFDLPEKTKTEEKKTGVSARDYWRLSALSLASRATPCVSLRKPFIVISTRFICFF